MSTCSSRQDGAVRMTTIAEFIDPLVEGRPAEGPQRLVRSVYGNFGEVLSVGLADRESRYGEIKGVVRHEVSEPLYEVHDAVRTLGAGDGEPFDLRSRGRRAPQEARRPDRGRGCRRRATEDSAARLRTGADRPPARAPPPSRRGAPGVGARARGGGVGQAEDYLEHVANPS